MTRRSWLALLALALMAPAALASAPRGASPTLPLDVREPALAPLEPAPAALVLEQALVGEEHPGFPLGLESLDAPRQRLAPLEGAQLLDEDLAAQLARTGDAEEPRYPETRIGGLRLFGQDLVVVSTPVSVDVRWGCADFGCGIAEGIGSWLSEDPAGTLDSPSLYAFVGNRPNLATDPTGTCVLGLPCPDWAKDQAAYWKRIGAKVTGDLQKAYAPIIAQAAPVLRANARLADSWWDSVTDGGKYTDEEKRRILDEYVVRSLEVGLLVEGFRAPAGPVTRPPTRLPRAPAVSTPATVPVSGDDWVGHFRATYGDEAVEWQSLKTGTYSDMKAALRGSGEQANHLNQNAAYGSIIPREEGLALGMRGNAFSEPGTEHFLFHSSMEGFWDQFRVGGARFGQVPSNAEYVEATRRALRTSGLSPGEAAELARRAGSQQSAAGLAPDAPVPQVPRRLNQRR